jgi:hypothetical protein
VELIGIESSKIIALFLAGRAEGAPYMPEAVASLVERYRFDEYPKSVTDMTGERVHFGHGLHRGKPIEQFDIFADGVIVNGKISTEILDDFLDDVIRWMEPTLGIKRIETHDINKIYESNIAVRSSVNLLSAMDGFSEIYSALTDGLRIASGITQKFQEFGIALAVDHSKIAGLKPAPFRLERRGELAFSKGLYGSVAPLPTKAHMAILHKIEKLAA